MKSHFAHQEKTTERVCNDTGWYIDRNFVTPVIKYTTLLVVIVLPFVGGWIGYMFASMQIQQVIIPQTKNIQQDTQINTTSLPYLQMQQLRIADNEYLEPIADFLSIPKAELYNTINTQRFVEIMRISDSVAVVNVCIDCAHTFTNILLFDIVQKKVLQDITATFPQDASMLWRPSPAGYAILLAVTNTTVAVYDFIGAYSSIVYTEYDENVSLCQAGVGCSADFSITNDGHIFFGRYQFNEGDQFSTLVDVATVELPSKYKI